MHFECWAEIAKEAQLRSSAVAYETGLNKTSLLAILTKSAKVHRQNKLQSINYCRGARQTMTEGLKMNLLSCTEALRLTCIYD